MWIVKLALRRPYTFIVAALLIVLATPFALRRTPVDVFPDVDIPAAAILLSYNGLSAREMADRIVIPVERNLANSVSDMEHVESQTAGGLGIIKVFFQPTVDPAEAIAQLVASTQASLRSLPAGSTPPTIVKYSASNLPIMQLGVSSKVLTEGELNDAAFNELRTRLVTIPGLAITAPFGGRFRQVSVDLDGPALAARGLTPVDVVNALSAQNLILPTGTAKLGDTEFNVALNGSPATIAALGDIPIRKLGGGTVFIRDVAHVHDGSQAPQTVVRRDGERGMLMTLLKNGKASTLDILDAVHRALPKAVEAMPPEVEVSQLADQSRFVRAAVFNVVEEAVIAASLTVALILLFLGNWRSTAIIAVSIPLSILSAVLLLHLTGQTINVMTLGGLALAVGILVDDATVEIENVERHLHMGKAPHQAILDGAAEIATPAFVSTLCICIVFLPVFLLSGVAHTLFVPLALSVVYAMLASWLLSRTLVPTLVMYLMRQRNRGGPAPRATPLRRVHLAFDGAFERLRAGYSATLAGLLQHKLLCGGLFTLFCLGSLALVPQLGRDFFPTVDAGQVRLHVRAPVATRIEEMPALIDRVEAEMRRVVGNDEIASLVDIVGGPYSPFNTLYSNNGTFDSSDTEILLSLKPGHAPTREHIRALRAALPRAFPGMEFQFQPADPVAQTLNFGLQAPIDIQFSGNKTAENLELATELMHELRAIDGAVDVTLFQRFNRPALALEMDRARLLQGGAQARDLAQNLLVQLSGSYQTAQTQWLNPANGNTYNVSVQTRQHEVDSLDALLRLPVYGPGAADTTSAGGGAAPRVPQLLGDLVSVKPIAQPAVVSRYNMTPVIDLYANVDGRDLGRVHDQIAERIEALRARLPRGSDITVRGQVQTMNTAFGELGLGLALAVALVYLLIVVNFQSWRDAAIILAGLPAALAGIAWMLFLTGTSLSVPALTGAVMTMGVATANSILVVSFARERLAAGVPALRAALDAGGTRLRPVMMTALAMITGMLPMALGAGEGGEQNAPLGRAVIGGLAFATISTLVFVPLVFAGVHGRRERRARLRGDALPVASGTGAAVPAMPRAADGAALSADLSSALPSSAST
ncbi:efflux RND transporter permease subunit [Derxia gummosa]|uniref:Efflux RND transporter permease subunit n=1 Tax=Derxia gummosa DSM 723 TaxID=1121388 RepID=A0A8B6XAY5_9BURK|nr:efflux RND transporter permease subunit [Derxia gummosa]